MAFFSFLCVHVNIHMCVHLCMVAERQPQWSFPGTAHLVILWQGLLLIWNSSSKQAIEPQEPASHYLPNTGIEHASSLPAS